METKPVALVTGITGQVAVYLCEHLLEKGYRVIGTKRRSSTPYLENVKHLLANPDFYIDNLELTDYPSVETCLLKYNPSQVYNLAAQSFVAESYISPIATFSVNTTGVLNILEVLRKRLPTTRLYQASSSEMFGKNYSTRQIETGKIIPSPFIKEFGGEAWPIPEYIEEKYQDEDTEFYPISPYSISKLASHQLCRLYRESYGIKCASGILFNHESKLRSKEFVTRKITDYIGRLVRDCGIKHTGYSFSFVSDKLMSYKKLGLGNLNASRDFGHAQDYARAQYLILTQPYEDMRDYVIATGVTRTIRDFCKASFDVVGLNYENHIFIDPQFYRPSEVDYLCGDSSKARRELGWGPKISFDSLVEEMVYADIERAYNER